MSLCICRHSRTYLGHALECGPSRTQPPRRGTYHRHWTGGADHDFPVSQSFIPCHFSCHHHHNHDDREVLMKAAAASEHEQSRRRARPQHGEVRRGMNGASSSSQAAHAAAHVPGQAAPLLAIIYSEFDNTLGPTIRCQAPEGYVCLACVSLRVSFALLASSLMLPIPPTHQHTASCPKSSSTAFPTTSSRAGSSTDAPSP